MGNNSYVAATGKGKSVSITVLYIIAIVIIFSGVLFSIFSFVKNITFSVLNSSVHGAVFGMVAGFLGVRYFLSVRKLKTDVWKPTSKFSWSNFKKVKAQKTIPEKNNKLSINSK